MNRRGFLGMLVGGVAVATAERTWPFRVFSFPAEVKPASYATYIFGKDAYLLSPGLSTIWYDPKAIEVLKENLVFNSPLLGPYLLERRSWVERLKL